METKISLSEAEWLNARAAQSVMRALQARRPGCARFVGGCVRNTLMGRAVDDIDIATQLEPEETIAALESAGIKAIPTGLEHGTITAIVDSSPFEITSLRQDVETDGRRAVVSFTQDWNKDAKRRDFRLNAIYASPEGQLFDPTGKGIEDAKAGQVIFIGDAETRLREDYLRILRFFRFNAWYGAKIDTKGLEACANQRQGLKQIAVERIWKEIKKLLAAPNPENAVKAMAKTGVLQIVLPAAQLSPAFTRLIELERAIGVPPDPMRRFLSLISRHQISAQELQNTLRLSGAETDRLDIAFKHCEPVSPDLPPNKIKQALYEIPFGSELDCVMLQAATTASPIADWTDVLKITREWQRPIFPISGKDLIKKGHKPGPNLGETLKSLEQDWVKRDFRL